MKLLRLILLLVMPLGASVNGANEGPRVLVFSKTLMFRHASITNGIKALKHLGAENRFQVDATEDSSTFTATSLARFQVIVFLSTSGDILSDAQTVLVEDHSHPSTAHLSTKWARMDEWYNFTASPRSKVHVLATLDEKSFHGGTMGADHPVVWTRSVGKGRLWYTALGHTEASFSEPEFLKHLLGGIRWAAKSQ